MRMLQLQKLSWVCLPCKNWDAHNAGSCSNL